MKFDEELCSKRQVITEANFNIIVMQIIESLKTKWIFDEHREAQYISFPIKIEKYYHDYVIVKFKLV